MEVKPGRYDNISIEKYHRECPGWSKSALDKVDRSMAHWFEERDNKPESTDSQVFGSALHCAVLTPALYESQFCVAPICDKRTKEGKEIYARFLLDNQGKQVVSNSVSESIGEMINSLNDHPFASSLFTNGDAEHSFFWTDKVTNLLCKCRPDYLRSQGVVVELKTCENASYFNFQRDAFKYRYHVQGAYFLDGISAIVGDHVKEFYIVAIEKSAPYEVAVFRLDEEAIKVGRIAYRENLNRVLQFEKSPEESRWPGYPAIIQDLWAPAWVA